MNQELEYIKRFHGHLGPYVVLGYKMGKFAMELMDCGMYWDLKIHTNMGITPPSSCLIDGLQLSTGCTLGKGNIEIGKGLLNTVSFFFKEKTCFIKIKNEILEEIKVEKDPEEFASRIFERNSDKLFEFEITLKENNL